MTDDQPAAATDAPSDPWTPAVLVAIRRDPRRRAAALTAAVAVGLAATWLHWLGLFVAGALVGLASRTVPRAALAGLVVGVLVLALTVFGHPTMGPGEFLALAPPSYVAIAAAFVAPVWGSLVRGVL